MQAWSGAVPSGSRTGCTETYTLRGCHIGTPVALVIPLSVGHTSPPVVTREIGSRPEPRALRGWSRRVIRHSPPYYVLQSAISSPLISSASFSSTHRFLQPRLLPQPKARHVLRCPPAIRAGDSASSLPLQPPRPYPRPGGALVQAASPANTNDSLPFRIHLDHIQGRMGVMRGEVGYLREKECRPVHRASLDSSAIASIHRLPIS